MIAWIESLFQRIHRQPLRWFFGSLALLTWIALAGPYAQIAERYGEGVLFDMHPTLEWAEAVSRVEILGDSGLSLYRLGLAIDLMFALANGVLLLVLLRAIRGASRPIRRMAFGLVALAVSADFLEDGCIGILLSSFARQSVLYGAWLATWGKIIGFVGALGIAAIAWAAKLGSSLGSFYAKKQEKNPELGR